MSRPRRPRRVTMSPEDMPAEGSMRAMSTEPLLRVDRDGATATVTLVSTTMPPAFFAECERVFGELSAAAAHHRAWRDARARLHRQGHRRGARAGDRPGRARGAGSRRAR